MALLRLQADLYVRLERYSQQQRALIVEEDTRPLLVLLAERQKLSLELARVSRRLSPVRENWPSFRERMTLKERTEAAELIDAMRGSLSRVIENDEQDARALSLRKEIVRTELSASNSKSTMAGAYRASGAASGLRLDEEQ